MLAARSAAVVRALVAPACVVVAGTLLWAGRSLPARPPALASTVEREMPATGVSNPVTAVLLDFRSYDTLLEVAVLVLALCAVGALAGVAGGRRREGAAEAGWGAAERAEPSPDEERRTEEGDAGTREAQAPQTHAAEEPRGAIGPAGGARELPGAPVLDALVGVVAPLAVVVAGYLWWAGSHAPGGAFQGGAVLGAVGVLLILAGRMEPAAMGRVSARGVAAGGLLAFLALAGAAVPAERAFLEHPPGHAGTTIFLLEGALTVSIAAILAALFADGHAR